jgi:hypothetical protein
VVAVVLVSLCLALCATLVIKVYQGFTSTGPHRVEYEGRVVDKSITVTESYTGSGAVNRLHVRGRDGAVFDVVVTADLYARARVGMWIRSDRNNGVELYTTEPTPAEAGTKTEGAETPSVSAPR